MDKVMEVSMNTMADPVVSFDKKEAVPRAPKAVCDPAPPKAPARSALFPDCSSTIRINIKQTITWIIVSKIIINSLPARVSLVSGTYPE